MKEIKDRRYTNYDPLKQHLYTNSHRAFDGTSNSRCRLQLATNNHWDTNGCHQRIRVNFE